MTEDEVLKFRLGTDEKLIQARTEIIKYIELFDNKVRKNQFISWRKKNEEYE